ncbi:hypothetical protein U1Q18_000399, partial [Sarracenia purpurea var. burkii]
VKFLKPYYIYEYWMIYADTDRKMQSAEQLVLDLSNPDLRENALLELSKVHVYLFSGSNDHCVDSEEILQLL